MPEAQQWETTPTDREPFPVYVVTKIHTHNISCVGWSYMPGAHCFVFRERNDESGTVTELVVPVDRIEYVNIG